MKEYKPFIYPDSSRWGSSRHKSCWDCDHILLRGQFNRRCVVHLKVFVWSGDSESELLDYPFGIGNTLADKCPDYVLNSEYKTLPEDRPYEVNLEKEEFMRSLYKERDFECLLELIEIRKKELTI